MKGIKMIRLRTILLAMSFMIIGVVQAESSKASINKNNVQTVQEFKTFLDGLSREELGAIVNVINKKGSLEIEQCALLEVFGSALFISGLIFTAVAFWGIHCCEMNVKVEIERERERQKIRNMSFLED